MILLIKMVTRIPHPDAVTKINCISKQIAENMPTSLEDVGHCIAKEKKSYGQANLDKYVYHFPGDIPVLFLTHPSN